MSMRFQVFHRRSRQPVSIISARPLRLALRRHGRATARSARRLRSMIWLHSSW